MFTKPVFQLHVPPTQTPSPQLISAHRSNKHSGPEIIEAHLYYFCLTSPIITTEALAFSSIISCEYKIRITAHTIQATEWMTLRKDFTARRTITRSNIGGCCIAFKIKTINSLTCLTCWTRIEITWIANKVNNEISESGGYGLPLDFQTRKEFLKAWCLLFNL